MDIQEAIEALYEKPTEAECKEIATMLKNLNEMHERACNDLHELNEKLKERSVKKDPPPRNGRHYLCTFNNTKVPAVLYQRDGYWTDVDHNERDPVTWRLF